MSEEPLRSESMEKTGVLDLEFAMILYQAKSGISYRASRQYIAEVHQTESEFGSPSPSPVCRSQQALA
jgi:hypothetical protein